MNGAETLYLALDADPSLSNLLSVVGGLKALTQGVVEPDSWGPKDSTVSLYQAGVRDYTLPILDNVITANCRALTEATALQIAGAVITAVNRISITGGGRYYCSQLGVLPPIDQTDSFNVPVEIQIKGQTALI